MSPTKNERPDRAALRVDKEASVKRFISAVLPTVLILSLAACSPESAAEPASAFSAAGSLTSETAANAANPDASVSAPPESSGFDESAALVKIGTPEAWNAFALDLFEDRGAYAAELTVLVTAPLDFAGLAFQPIHYAAGLTICSGSAPDAADGVTAGEPGFYNVSETDYAGLYGGVYPSDAYGALYERLAGKHALYRCANLVFENCLSPIALHLPGDGEIVIENIVARASVQRWGAALPTGEPDSYRSYTLRSVYVDGGIETSEQKAALTAHLSGLYGNLLADETGLYLGCVRAGGGLLVSRISGSASKLVVSGVTVKNAAVSSWLTSPEEAAYDCAALLCGRNDTTGGCVEFSDVLIENCFGYGVSVAALCTGTQNVTRCENITVRGCDLTSPVDLDRLLSAPQYPDGYGLAVNVRQSSHLLFRHIEWSPYFWPGLPQNILVEDCAVCVDELPPETLDVFWNGMRLVDCKNTTE